VGSVQIAAALLVGGACEWLHRVIGERLPASRVLLVRALVAAVVLVPVLGERWSFAAVNGAWIEETVRNVQRDPDIVAVLEPLRGLPAGRVYAGLRTNWGERMDFGSTFRGIHFYDVITEVGLDPVRPPSYSFSLNSDLIFDLNESRPGDLQVFNARYVIAPSTLAPPADWRPVKAAGRYTLYAVATTGYAQYVAVAGRIQPASQAELLQWNRRWLASGDPAAGRYLRVDWPRVNPAPAAEGGCPQPAYESERVGPDRFEFVVSCPQGATLAIKSTYHPNWRVTVDGTEQPTFMVSPSYLAVAVPAGRHTVQAQYVGAPYKVPLAVLGVAVLAAVMVLRKRIEERLDGLAGYVRGRMAREPGPRGQSLK